MSDPHAQGARSAADDTDAALIAALLAWEPIIDIARLAGDAGFSAERTVASLACLAASGRVGYDLAEGAFFHRELPFGDAAYAGHPRLADARSLGGFIGSRSANDVATWPLLCPHQPELVAAHLLKPLSDGLESGRSAATPAVHRLAGVGLTGAGIAGSGLAGASTRPGPGRPLGRLGHLALVTGLASAEPDTRIAAAEAWTRMASDGRLDPALAAEAITLGVTAAVFKLNRIADGLQHATLEATAAAGVARAAAAAAAALLPVPARPPGLHLLLEIVGRCAATAGVPELPTAITDLARTRDRTKLAEVARRLARL